MQIIENMQKHTFLTVADAIVYKIKKNVEMLIEVTLNRNVIDCHFSYISYAFSGSAVAQKSQSQFI